MKKYISIALLLFYFSSMVVFADNSQTIVHITKTGECYHTADCGSLRSDIPVTLEYAVSHGYRACSKCHPPVLDTEIEYAEPEPKTTYKSSSNYNSYDYSDDDYDYDKLVWRNFKRDPHASGSQNNNTADKPTPDENGWYTAVKKPDPKPVKQVIEEPVQTKKPEPEATNTGIIANVFNSNKKYAVYASALASAVMIGRATAKKSSSKKLPEQNTEIEKNNVIKYAYITKNGKCYHMTPNCTFIRAGCQQVDYEYIKFRRSPCSNCAYKDYLERKTTYKI